MSKKNPVVWVVMHYEYIGCADFPWIDALQFHVSSSLAKAEKFIRAAGVEPHSWWQVHPHKVDTEDSDDGEEVHYYSHSGRPLKAAPYTRAKAAFRKLAASDPDHYPTLAAWQES